MLVQLPGERFCRQTIRTEDEHQSYLRWEEQDYAAWVARGGCEADRTAEAFDRLVDAANLETNPPDESF